MIISIILQFFHKKKNRQGKFFQNYDLRQNFLIHHNIFVFNFTISKIATATFLGSRRGPLNRWNGRIVLATRTHSQTTQRMSTEQ